MRSRPLSLSWARRIQPTPFQPIPLIYMLILYHLRQCLSTCLFPSECPTKTLYAPLLPLKRVSCPAHLIFLDLITHIIFVEQYRSWNVSLSFPLPCNLDQISFTAPSSRIPSTYLNSDKGRVWGLSALQPVGRLYPCPNEFPSLLSRGATHHVGTRDLCQRRRELYKEFC